MKKRFLLDIVLFEHHNVLKYIKKVNQNFIYEKIKSELNSENYCCHLFQNVLSCRVFKNVQIIRRTKLYFTSCWV
jgi:hypothetical protein